MSTVKAPLYKSTHTQFPHLVGFDQLVEQLSRPSRKVGYPPHNIVKVDDDQYSIELAVAGFTMEDLNIELDGHTLVVTGEVTQDEEVQYIYKGLSTRSFVKKFELADNVEVSGATIGAGILRIVLQIVSADTKAVQIDITEDV